MFPSIESSLYRATSKSKTIENYSGTGATHNGAEVRIDGCWNIMFQLIVTAMTGANQTQDLKIQHRKNASDSWLDTGLAFTQAVVAGGATWNQAKLTTGPLLPRVRINATGGGTTTTCAYKVLMTYVQGARGRFVSHGQLN
jgi:hypothetical protein